jgi:hypothetical protein
MENFGNCMIKYGILISAEELDQMQSRVDVSDHLAAPGDCRRHPAAQLEGHLTLIVGQNVLTKPTSS